MGFLQYFTQVYKPQGYYMKRKSEVTLVFFLLMSLYGYINLFLTEELRQSQHYLYIGISVLVALQVLMFFLLRKGFLKAAQLIFFILGFMVGIRYLVFSTHYQFYTHLIVLLMVGVVIQVSKSQMYIIYIYVNTTMLVRGYFIYSLVTVGFVEDVLWHQSLQASLGVIIFSLVAAKLNHMIHSGIKETKELGEISLTDSLTHLANRSKFNQDLENKVSNNEAYTLVLLDIDHFKKINDALGHDKGDVVLIALANLMRDIFEENYGVYRWGGEEFALIFASSDINSAINKVLYDLEAFRHHLKTYDFGIGYPLTVSGGIYNNKGKTSAKQAVIFADNALYDAKNQGRNRVVVSEVQD